MIAIGDTPTVTDGGLVGHIALLMWEKFGDEKYLAFAQRILDKFEDWPRDSKGQIKYDADPDNGYVYVDGTGMATPFYAVWSYLFDDAEKNAISVLQIENYLKYGVQPRTYLTFHGYEKCSITQGELGWGRGTGWFMFAVGAVMRYCGNDEINAKCETYIEKTFKYLMKDKNMFSWSLSEPDGPSDTSATGMILWGVMKAKEVGLAGCISDRTLKDIAFASLGEIEDGVVYGSTLGSPGWGAYSDVYDANTEFGQGSILAFLAMYVHYLER